MQRALCDEGRTPYPNILLRLGVRDTGTCRTRTVTTLTRDTGTRDTVTQSQLTAHEHEQHETLQLGRREISRCSKFSSGSSCLCEARAKTRMRRGTCCSTSTCISRVRRSEAVAVRRRDGRGKTEMKEALTWTRTTATTAEGIGRRNLSTKTNCY